jgi:hypothetical protein
MMLQGPANVRSRTLRAHMIQDKIFSRDAWGPAFRLTLAPLLTVLAVWVQVQRVLLAEVSAWTEIVLPLLYLGALISAFWALSTEALRSWTLRLLHFILTLALLFLSYPALHLVRDSLIESAEVRTVGSIVERKKSIRRQRYSVRVEFGAAGTIYTTGWIRVGRDRMPIGGSVTVRYFADDPRVAEIARAGP